MFLKYRKNVSLLINSHEITMFLLNFILTFSMLRISKHVSCSFKARISSASIHGHPFLLPLPGLLPPSLVKKFPWISDILGLVILHLLSSTKLSNQISCPCFHQNPLPCALHVNRERVTAFIQLFPFYLKYSSSIVVS
jgi:hypothetical protein